MEEKIGIKTEKIKVLNNIEYMTKSVDGDAIVKFVNVIGSFVRL